DRRWRRVSYSSLAHGASFDFEDGSPWAEGEELHPLSTRGVESQLSPPHTDDPSTPTKREHGALPLADFPRGPDAGTFLHHFLELLDFPRAHDDAYFDALALDLMRREGVPEAQLDALRVGIRAMLATPLSP